MNALLPAGRLRATGPADAALGLAFALLLATIAGAAVPRADSLAIAAPATIPAAALLSLAAALMARKPGDRLLGWAGLAASLCWAGVLAQPLLAARTAPATARNVSVRLVSFNIYRDNADLPRAIAWARAQHADVIVLLEARMRERPEFTDLRADFPYAQACARDLRCTTVILARRPFRAVWSHTRGDPENRKALSSLTVLLDLGCARVPLTAAHLSRPWPLGSQHDDFRDLRAAVAAEGRGGLLVGDFNSAPWTFAMRRLAATGRLRLASGARPTWPVPTPWLPLDQVYVGPAVTVARLQRGPDLGSDHRPLVTDLTLPCP